MANLTRRLFLRRAATIAPLAVIPAAAAPMPETKATAGLIQIEGDRTIARLARAFRAADRKSSALRQAMDDLKKQARAAYSPSDPEPQMTPAEREEFNRATVADIISDRFGPLYTAHVKRHAAWREARKAEEKAFEARPLADPAHEALRQEWARAHDALHDIGKRLYKTPARTLDDIAIKMRVQRDIPWADAWGERQIAKDLRALKKAGAVIAVPAGRA